MNYAARALNEMYGHTLNGLIKNGIRLSYSKNPLGVRSPSLSNGAAGPPAGLHSLHDSGAGRLGSIDAGRFGSGNVKGYDGFSLDGPPIPPRRQREASMIDARLATNNNYEMPGPRTTRHMSLAGMGGLGGGEFSSGLSIVPEHSFNIGGGFDRSFQPSSASSPPRPRYFSPTGERVPSILSPVLSNNTGVPSAFGSLNGLGGGYSHSDLAPQSRQAPTRSSFSPFGNDAPFGDTPESSFPSQQQQSSLYQRFDERDEIFTPAGDRYNGAFDGGLPTTLYNSNNFAPSGLSMGEGNSNAGDTR